jgi:hypothetical protein
MFRYLVGALVITSVFFFGCTSTEKSRTTVQPVITPETKSVAVEDTKKKPRVRSTFLDTINEGNELALSDNDFDRGSGQAVQSVPSTTSSVTTDIRYRVQVFASNRIETVREQKKELEKKVPDQVLIAYEAPYYKLYTGSFQKRQDAQLILLKLKKLGYNDAWIVSTSIVPEN